MGKKSNSLVFITPCITLLEKLNHYVITVFIIIFNNFFINKKKKTKNVGMSTRLTLTHYFPPTSPIYHLYVQVKL